MSGAGPSWLGAGLLSLVERYRNRTPGRTYDLRVLLKIIDGVF